MKQFLLNNANFNNHIIAGDFNIDLLNIDKDGEVFLQSKIVIFSLKYHHFFQRTQGFLHTHCDIFTRCRYAMCTAVARVKMTQ